MIDILPLSFFIGVGFILLNKYVTAKWNVNLRDSPQTLHPKSISRFGGIAIFLSLLIISFSSDFKEYGLLIDALVVSSPVFFLGLADDLNFKIKPALRLILIFCISSLFYFFLGIKASSVEIPAIDWLLEYQLFSIMFICFAITGTINAFNMIDGINGLLMLFCLSICVSIFIFPQSAINVEYYLYLVALIFAVLGIFILNFPFGKIFLGDGGAYFLGAMMVIVLVKYYQINELSPWYVFLMLIYPITDVIFSIFRRIYVKLPAMNPDDDHLHHLIYKRIKRFNFASENKVHFFVTLSTFVFYMPFLLGANYFSYETNVLQLLSFIFISMYVFIYVLLAPKNLFNR